MASAEHARHSKIALLGVFSLSFLTTEEAGAYCRTTTCDPRTEHCESQSGCIMSGAPLAWPDRCVSFGTQEDGSKKRKISYQAADNVFRNAFQEWATAACEGGARPSFQVWDLGDAYGGIVCEEPEFNKSSPNASVWLFRDDDWPYDNDDATLAMTTVQFEKSSGVILDADVEINSFSAALTITNVDGRVQQDLASISTHEAGHFLGLSHTPIKEATMFARYASNTTGIRTLHPDDVRGICAAYPPDRETLPCDRPRPPHGFSRYCGNEPPDEANAKFRGCAVTAPSPRSSSSVPLWFIAGLLGAGMAAGVGRRFLARRGASR